MSKPLNLLFQAYGVAVSRDIARHSSHHSGPRRHKLAPGQCPYCDRERDHPHHPYHDASARCESGRHNHCTCDLCF